jgi:hypothetical protein
MHLGDSVMYRMGDSVVFRMNGRLSGVPNGRLGALFPYWCSPGAIRPFLQPIDTFHAGPRCGGGAGLLGVPARPVFVNTHANINRELLGRPLT